MILVVVFALGLAAGIVGMVYAWPGLRAHFRHRNEPLSKYLQRTLSLTPEQMPRVEAVLNDNSQRRHQIHLEFRPKYAKICDEFSQLSQQELETYAPVRQQTLDQIKSILTPQQWQKFQSQRSSHRGPQRRPDLCHALYGAPGAPSTPGGAPPAGGQPPRGR